MDSDNDLTISLPSIEGQRRFVFEQATRGAIATLKDNLDKPVFEGPDIDESQYPRTHLLSKSEGWEPPHNDLVHAYFENFKQAFPEYGSDEKLAYLLGLSSGRRVREYKSGAKRVPYEVWRMFLVITGRAPQEVRPVFGYFK